jgi:hypothetical protein
MGFCHEGIEDNEGSEEPPPQFPEYAISEEAIHHNRIAEESWLNSQEAIHHNRIAVESWLNSQAAHMARIEASNTRRAAFLQSKQEEFSAHCLTCLDMECRRTHQRRGRWLGRGKLVACPKKLSDLPSSTLGLLLGHRTGKATRARLERESYACEEIISWKRKFGLAEAIYKQERDKANRQDSIELYSGNLKGRLGMSLAEAIAQLPYIDISTHQGPTKVFKGFCLPKRGARTGDYYVNDTEKAICTGYNRWTFMNGANAVLVGNRWTYTE